MGRRLQRLPSRRHGLGYAATGSWTDRGKGVSLCWREWLPSPPAKRPLRREGLNAWMLTP
jgi:hypothetical protein